MRLNWWSENLFHVVSSLRRGERVKWGENSRGFYRQDSSFVVEIPFFFSLKCPSISSIIAFGIEYAPFLFYVYFRHIFTRDTRRWRIDVIFFAVVDETTIPREVANQARIAKLSTERDSLYDEDGDGIVSGEQPGRGGVVLRQATTATASSSTASLATIAIANRSEHRCVGQRRRGQREDCGSARFHGRARNVRGIGQVRHCGSAFAPGEYRGIFPGIFLDSLRRKPRERRSTDRSDDIVTSPGTITFPGKNPCTLFFPCNIPGYKMIVYIRYSMVDETCIQHRVRSVMFYNVKEITEKRVGAGRGTTARWPRVPECSRTRGSLLGGI